MKASRTGLGQGTLCRCQASVNTNASMESVKPRFAVERHLRELFATEGQEEPEPAADAEPSLLTSEAGPSPLEAIHEETTPLSEALAPPIPVCESTVAVPVPLPVSLEDSTRQDWARTNKESHVDVCTRVGNHSRGDGACGPCGLSERHLGDAAARCTGRTVSGRAVCGALSSRRATGLRALATSGGHRVAIRGESHGPTSRRCGA